MIVIDFDDILLYTYELLIKRPDILKIWDLKELNQVSQNIIINIFTKGTSAEKEEYSIFDNEKDGVTLKNDIKRLIQSGEVYIDVCGIAGDYCVLETIKGLMDVIGNQYITILEPYVASIDGGEKLKAFATEKLGIVPFSTFEDDEKPTDPLGLEVVRYMEDSTLTSVSWNFTAFPSQTFKDQLGYALLDYCNDTSDWDGVVSAFVDGWKTEKEASAE